MGDSRFIYLAMGESRFLCRLMAVCGNAMARSLCMLKSRCSCAGWWSDFEEREEGE